MEPVLESDPRGKLGVGMSRRGVRSLLALALVVVSACSVSEAAQPLTTPARAIPEVTGLTPDKASPGSTDAVGAPEFTGRTISGTTVRGTELWRSGPVVMVFFASWCGTCAQNQPVWNDLAARYAGRAKFVGVVPDEQVDQLTEYLATHPVSYQVISDPDKRIWRSFGVTEAPLVVLIGTGGRLLRGWPGGVSGAELDRALAGAVVT